MIELVKKLEGLRAELGELAFALDREGSRAAADVAMDTAARLAELCVEARGAVRPVGDFPEF